jgi:serine/threonine protein kinase
VQAPAAAGQSSASRAAGQQTLRPPASAEETSSDELELAPPAEYPFLASPKGADELGRLGPYRVLKVLGTGAMGVVFQAEDPHLKRLVALKVMRPSLAASEDFHRRFLREARLAAAIDHEHIVTVYQAGEDRGVPFMAMKLLQGQTLEDKLKKAGGRLPLPEVLRIGREIAEGLAAAHEHGLVHRDVKPANVWLEAGRGRVKIVDFGLARGAGPDAQFTQAGAVIGTPAYMAPEQAGAADVDARCDLFSLGAVLYRAATGELPFGGKDTLSVLHALANKTPTPPHQRISDLPRAFSGLVMRLLSKDPADRPQTAQEVVELIAALERGETEEEEEVLTPVDEAPAGPGEEVEEAPPPPAPKAEVKRSEPKKARPSGARKKKRAEAQVDWGRLVLWASLALLGVALVVLLIALMRHAG